MNGTNGHTIGTHHDTVLLPEGLAELIQLRAARVASLERQREGLIIMIRAIENEMKAYGHNLKRPYVEGR